MKHETVATIKVPESILAPCADPEVRVRRAVEYRIVHKLVGDLLAAGFTLWVDHGDGPVVLESNDVEPMAELFACDEEILRVSRTGERVGWVRLVYGNDGWDVISDYTTNLEEQLKAVNEYADRQEGV